MIRELLKLAVSAPAVKVAMLGVFRYSPPPKVIPDVSAVSVTVKLPLKAVPFRVPAPVPVKM